MPAAAAIPTQTAHFPEVHSRDLNGRQLTLPRDLPAERSVVILGWQRDQQPAIETWAKALASTDSAVPWVQVPVIDTSNAFLRMVISSGMRHGIPNHAVWSHVVTLYTSKAIFDQALAITDEHQVQALVVDRTGTVHERIIGDYTPAGAARIQAALIQ